MKQTNYYDILDVRPDADFTALRQAYRARAMASHPDRHGGDAAKADEFKAVAEAFNVLSDPLARRAHDLAIGAAATGTQVPDGFPAFDMGTVPEDEDAILDTLADDILEELIVGNVVPEGTSLQTLMLDLEQTDQFCLFREAKTRLYTGYTVLAEGLFREYIAISPINILARYFLAKCCAANGDFRAADKQLRMAIRIGERRRPPLRLLRLRRELESLRHQRPGFLGTVYRLFSPPPHQRNDIPADVAERRALNRAINRLALERMRKDQNALKLPDAPRPPKT